MTTESITQPGKRRAKKTRAIVERDGVDCGLAHPSDLGVNPGELSFRAGLLVKRPNDPHVFQGEKQAQRFITKTQVAIAKLKNAPLDFMKLPRLKPLFDGDTFTVRTFRE